MFNEQFEYKQNANIYNPEIKVTTMYKIPIIMNNYSAFFKSNPLIRKHYPNYANIIDTNYKNIMLYEPTHPSFIISYIMLHPIQHNSISLYTSVPTILEAILYSTLNEDDLQITQYNLNDGNTSEYKLYFNSNIEKLQKIYDNFKYIPTLLTSYNTNVINNLKKNKSKLVIFSFVQQHGNKLFRTNEFQHYFYTVLALNSLYPNGSYYFSWSYYSKNYMLQIMSVLALYFKKIKIEKNEITNNYFIKCIDYHTQISDKDNNVLLKILDKWSELTPNGGLTLNFSDQKLLEDYEAYTPFDKSVHIDLFVTNILNITIPTKVSNKINKMYTSISKYYNNIITNISSKYNKLITDITEDNLIDFYNNNYESYLNNCIALCIKHQIPLKPEYINTIISYNDELAHDIIVMQRPLIIELVDYDKYCNISLDMFKNKYFDTNKVNEQKLNYTKKVRPIQRMVTVVDNASCSNILLKPKTYVYADNKYLVSPIIDNLRKQLNIYKFNIDIIGDKTWSKINFITNIQSYLVYYIKHKYNFNVTKAFIKMYELCYEFKLIDFNQDIIKSFSTCEAPGHFVNAINYYIKSNKSTMTFDWNANSLNPNNPTNISKYGANLVSDSYGFIKNYPNRWIFGKDDTGNITNPDNIRYFKSKYNYSLDLFTSDCGLGSFTRSDYFNQEKKMAILNYCQCLIALLTLKIGGHAVFKLFIPLNESVTISVIYLIMKHFEHIYFIKQLAGSPVNNEIYIVAKNKTEHLQQDLEEYLFDCLNNFNPELGLFPINIYNKYFIRQIEKISKEFIDKQINSLVKTFYYHNNPSILEDHKPLLDKAKVIYSETWLQNMNFKKIDTRL